MKSQRRGVGYMRRSSSRQLENHSLEVQRSQILQCAKVNGYEITDWFLDDAVSAYRKSALKREAMRELLSTVLEQDEVSGVFFYDESRVSRQMSDFVLEIYNPIRDRKPDCAFYNASSGPGLWDPDSTVVQAQLLVAAKDSAIKSSRALDTQAAMLRDPRGPRRPGSPAPYGYHWDKGVLVPGEHAEIALFLFYLASWGYSDVRIAQILNDAGVPAPKLGSWRASTIDVLLNNPHYCGDLAWNRRKGYSNSARKPTGQYDLFEGQIDAIVPRPLWDMVQQLRALKTNTGVKLDSPNMVHGIAYCKKCDVKLNVRDSTPSRSPKRYVRYVCPSCRGKIETTKLDEVVLNQLGRDWPGQVSKFKNEARKAIIQWKKELLEVQRGANEELEEAKYQRAMLSPSSPFPEQWEKIIALREEVAQGQLQNTISLLKEVEQLSQESVFDAWMERFMEPDWTSLLSDTERRTFCFSILHRIDVEFTTVPKVSICFKLSPFISLTDRIGRLTEFNPEVLGEKPNREKGA